MQKFNKSNKIVSDVKSVVEILIFLINNLLRLQIYFYI